MNKCIVCRKEDARSIHEYFCDGCVTTNGAGKLTGRGIQRLVGRIQKLEYRHTDGVIKIDPHPVVNENISAELGIPDAKDIITIQCVGPSHDGQWVRRSSYNELADEAGRRDVQRKMALEDLANANLENERINMTVTRLRRERDEARKTNLRNPPEWQREVIRVIDESGVCVFHVAEIGQKMRAFAVKEMKL